MNALSLNEKIINFQTAVKAAPVPDTQPSQPEARLRLVKKSPPSTPQSDKIRAELNIEKWPAIWRPASSKTKATVRVLERELNDLEGTVTKSRVEVGFTQWGTLTTEEQKMFYALVKQWEDSGKPEVQVFFSDRSLQRLLKKKWGTNVIDAITKALRKLRSTPIEWTNSYKNKTDKGVVLKDRRIFTILSELRLIEREVDGSTNKAVGYFKFDDSILNNLLNNYTKPLLLDTIIGINSEIGQLLYVHVDLMLARKDFYERRSKELFQDLGLTNPEYNRQYERKRKLEKAIRELVGLPISTGVLKIARIEKTNDKQDYKVVFQKGSAIVGASEGETVTEETSTDIVINDYSKPKDPFLIQAEELVQHFQKVFHAVDEHAPQSKETGQALALITQHGVEKAKYVVDFSFHAAKDTRFEIQHFGGVLQYTSRALADFEAHKQQQQKSRQFMERQSQELEQEDEARAKAEARLAALTPEQYKARFEAAKAELFQQYPFMTRQKDGNKIHEGAIRARMIRTITDEPMDLLVIDLPPESGN